MLAERFDAFLVDLDGVVYIDDEPIPSATAAIAELRDRGKQIRFLTNNSRRPRTALAARLCDTGIPTTTDDIISSASVTGSVLRKQEHENVFVIGTSGFELELRQQGFEVGTTDPDAVVVGLDREATYRDIELGARAVRNGATFVAANVDATFPTAEGIAPGTGALVSAVQVVADEQPIIVGKPQTRMFERALNTIEPDADTVMIGDNVQTDILGSHRAGLPSILVIGHGVDCPSQMDTKVEPDEIVTDLSELFEEP